MKLEYQIDKEQIADMDLTISVTMSVSQWLSVMRVKHEDEIYQPMYKLQNAISTAIGDLNRAVSATYTVV